jgi:hypothetical protein
MYLNVRSKDAASVQNKSDIKLTLAISLWIKGSTTDWIKCESQRTKNKWFQCLSLNVSSKDAASAQRSSK